MKILILGCWGMLGHELMKIFEKEEVRGWDFKELDITDRKAVEKAINKLDPEVVINAAAYTSVDDCETSIDKALKINGNAVGYLASACAQNGSILVHFSTDYVFDGKKKAGNSEEDIMDPINVYGQSKAKGELLIQEVMTRYYIVRTSWLYGKNGKNFVDMMLNMAKEKRVARVVNDQNGSPTYALDLAETVALILKEEKPFGIYHVTNSGSTTWYDFAREIFKIMKQDVPLQAVTSKEFPRAAKRPEYSILLNSKLKPLRPWKEALRDYLNLKG
ncbi:MAG: dTDP-4-dehydrorhamnose reductase [bacterium]